MGRPSDYTPEIAQEICQRIVDGKPLRKICEEVGISLATIFNWCNNIPEFLEQYARAREIQAEVMADELREIADEEPYTVVGSKPTGDEKEEIWGIDRAGIDRNRLRVDTRKWIASKMLPKKYGDKLGLEVSGLEGLAARLAEAQKRVEE